MRFKSTVICLLTISSTVFAANDGLIDPSISAPRLLGGSITKFFPTSIKNLNQTLDGLYQQQLQIEEQTKELEAELNLLRTTKERAREIETSLFGLRVKFSTIQVKSYHSSSRSAVGVAPALLQEFLRLPMGQCKIEQEAGTQEYFVSKGPKKIRFAYMDRRRFADSIYLHVEPSTDARELYVEVVDTAAVDSNYGQSKPIPVASVRVHYDVRSGTVFGAKFGGGQAAWLNAIAASIAQTEPAYDIHSTIDCFGKDE